MDGAKQRKDRDAERMIGVGGRAILIAGASVRAAAQSAVRWGKLGVVAADMFVDQDLASLVNALPLADSYADLPERAHQFSRAGEGVTHWCYTGGLENYPELIDRVSLSLKLLGNPGDTLRSVRDPRHFAESVRAAGLQVPEIVVEGHHLPTDGTWLLKHTASAGGLRVFAWNKTTKRHCCNASLVPAGPAHGEEIRDDAQRPVTWYWQRRVRGPALGAAFVAARTGVRLLGVTQQLQPNIAGRHGAMLYAGSLGPRVLSSQENAQWQALGERLASDFGLQGLFGVDAIAGECDLWPLEVNPRWTASLEVLERAYGWNAMQLHVEACDAGVLPGRHCLLQRPAQWVAKQVVYAPHSFVVNDLFSEWIQKVNRDAGFRMGPIRDDAWPLLADLPHPGATIPAGAPVLTTFAQRSDDLSLTVNEVLFELSRDVAQRATDVLQKIPARIDCT